MNVLDMIEQLKDHNEDMEVTYEVTPMVKEITLVARGEGDKTKLVIRIPSNVSFHTREF